MPHAEGHATLLGERLARRAFGRRLVDLLADHGDAAARARVAELERELMERYPAKYSSAALNGEEPHAEGGEPPSTKRPRC